MKIHIKNGRVIDPKNKVDSKLDVYIAAGKIVSLGDLVVCQGDAFWVSDPDYFESEFTPTPENVVTQAITEGNPNTEEKTTEVTQAEPEAEPSTEAEPETGSQPVNGDRFNRNRISREKLKKNLNS